MRAGVTWVNPRSARRQVLFACGWFGGSFLGTTFAGAFPATGFLAGRFRCCRAGSPCFDLHLSAVCLADQPALLAQAGEHVVHVVGGRSDTDADLFGARRWIALKENEDRLLALGPGDASCTRFTAARFAGGFRGRSTTTTWLRSRFATAKRTASTGSDIRAELTEDSLKLLLLRIQLIEPGADHLRCVINHCHWNSFLGGRRPYWCQSPEGMASRLRRPRSQGLRPGHRSWHSGFPIQS